MGLIKKQSIQTLIYTNIGVLIGFLNSAVIIPRLFEPYQNGLISFTNSLTSMFATLFTIGLPLVTIKFVPKIRDNKKLLNGLYTLIVIGIVLGIAGGAIFFLLFKNQWIDMDNGVRAINGYFWIFFVIFSFRLIAKQFDSLASIMYNAVVGAALENVLLKALFLIALLTFHYLLDLPDVWLLIFVGIAFISPGVFMLFYHKKYKLTLKRKALETYFSGNKKEIKTVALFGIIGSLGSIIVLDIDRIMLGNMMTLEDTGVYSVCFFFGLFVGLPTRSINRVAYVVTADAWEENDRSKLLDIYQKSSLTSLIFSSYLFLGVWFCFPYYSEFMLPEYQKGLWVVFFIGLSKVIESLFGVSHGIIMTSKHYKLNSYLTLVLLFTVVGLNYFMIPKWGINGAAFASFIALLVLGILRYSIIKKKMNLQPFSWSHLKVILLGLTIFSIMTWLPITSSGLYGILWSGLATTILFWIPMLFLKPSEEIHSVIVDFLKKLGINLKSS